MKISRFNGPLMEVLPALCILGIQITEISLGKVAAFTIVEKEKVMAEERPGHSHTPSTTQEVSLQPEKGWHVSHLFYRFNRGRLQQMSAAERIEGSRVLCELLRPGNPDATTRLQTWIVPGHKADFGVVSMDPSPLRVDEIHQRILSGPLGDAIEPAWSFIGLTEVSEYVPTVEQFGKRLVEEGVAEGSAAWQAKVNAYASREEGMRRARLEPDFPPWPNACFYPMNKKRKVGENWFALPLEDRMRLMAEHGRTGMTFAGRVTQLITVSVGLDDWEWGVTLWARRPDFLKEIVYKMRFDEASARYAEFGPFYTGYIADPIEMLRHCRIVD
ncbi:MAG: heme-dependent peroxidase [Pirellulales bacterium]|nr:heme-dependent peroxidase [Pirellulales bacterium]